MFYNNGKNDNNLNFSRTHERRQWTMKVIVVQTKKIAN